MYEIYQIVFVRFNNGRYYNQANAHCGADKQKDGLSRQMGSYIHVQIRFIVVLR